MTYFDDHQAAFIAELKAAYDAGAPDGDGLPLTRGDANELDPEALGYGSDLYCDLDVPANFAEVSGDSPVAVGQAAVRFLLGGSKFIDPAWNAMLGDDSQTAFDLYGMLSVGTTLKQFAAAKGIAQALLVQQDDRIASAVIDFDDLGQGHFRVRMDLELNSGGSWSNVFVLTAERQPQ